MTRMVIDPVLSARLSDLKEPTEFCDETGRTLGQFIPVMDRSLYARVQVPFTEEELRQAEEEPGMYTTAEVLAHLEKLKCSESSGRE